MLACSTPAIEEHYSVLNAMGNRFLFWRVTVEDPGTQAEYHDGHDGRGGTQIRDELLHSTTAGVVTGIEVPDEASKRTT